MENYSKLGNKFSIAGRTKTQRKKLYVIANAIEIPNCCKGGRSENERRENAAMVVRAEPKRATPVEEIVFTML